MERLVKPGWKMNQVFDDPIIDRLAGATVGLLCGDALGMPVEGWSAEEIEGRFGWLDRMVPGRLPAGGYTDDGQMALGLLDSLVRARGFDPPVCAQAWRTGFDPVRGYGRRIQGVMDRLAAGEDWRLVGTDSYGNGAAMRVGPLGVWLHDRPGELRRAALDSARITHHHPEARAGALVLALVCAEAVRTGLAGEGLEPGRVIEWASVEAATVDSGMGRALARLADLQPGSGPMIRDQLRRLYDRGVRTGESVPPALGAFLFTDNFRDAVCTAVNCGRDADTIGAMAGAMAGARYGFGAIPPEWLALVEGRDRAVELCLRAGEIIG